MGMERSFHDAGDHFPGGARALQLAVTPPTDICFVQTRILCVQVML